MVGKLSNAASPDEWIRNGEVSRESYLWVINPLLYPGGPTGAIELGDGGAQEQWRSGSGTQERRDCRQKVRGSTWNVWEQTVTVQEQCVDIVLMMTGVCSWWWLRWLYWPWLPDSNVLLKQGIYYKYNKVYLFFTRVPNMLIWSALKIYWIAF